MKDDPVALVVDPADQRVNSGNPLPIGLGIGGCENEPIHLPGSIQPYDLLLVVDPKTLKVV